MLRILSRATRRTDRQRSSIQRVTGPATDAVRRLRRQDKRRDRTNIRAHYDLGNDFFEHFLDPTMMYSAAVFPTWDAPLEDASKEKLDRLCRMLDLRPDERVVEIGTGWGGFAVHAARHYGARVTTTTISAEQHAYATERVAREGLSDRITVLHDDYRDLTGTYDKLASIEMIEAVDWREHDTFFGHCRRLLRPDGLMALQAIVIEPQRYERAKNTQDFIKAFIFPGGCLPSMEAIVRSISRVTDLTVTAVDDYGLHYGETLRRWRANLHARRERPRRHGPRRALRADVGLLPLLLRGGLRRAGDQRRADGAGPPGMAPPRGADGHGHRPGRTLDQRRLTLTPAEAGSRIVDPDPRPGGDRVAGDAGSPPEQGSRGRRPGVDVSGG